MSAINQKGLCFQPLVLKIMRLAAYRFAPGRSESI
jgi:hypothetical protein